MTPCHLTEVKLALCLPESSIFIVLKVINPHNQRKKILVWALSRALVRPNVAKPLKFTTINEIFISLNQSFSLHEVFSQMITRRQLRSVVCEQCYKGNSGCQRFRLFKDILLYDKRPTQLFQCNTTYLWGLCLKKIGDHWVRQTFAYWSHSYLASLQRC